MQEKQYDFPTEVLDLPSEGKVYPKDHPLASGRITIKLMTVKEEDILSSTNLIKKGIVLDKLFESITGRRGYADFYKKDIDFYMLGPVGDKIEQWKLKGAFINQANFGDVAFDSNEPATIELTLSYDYAILEF